LDAVDLKLAPTTARHLFSTVEWFGITVVAFMADFWLRVHYAVYFILLLPLLPHTTTHPPPTHPHTTLILKLVPTQKSAQKQPSWILKVRYTKANDLVHILMG